MIMGYRKLQMNATFFIQNITGHGFYGLLHYLRPNQDGEKGVTGLSAYPDAQYRLG
jgi:hypothetical protein